MPTLYEQTLVELRARLDALPGLGPAGVMRGDAFTPERTQVPAIDIADGTQRFKALKGCGWDCTGDPQFRVNAASEVDRDALTNLAVAALGQATWPAGVVVSVLSIEGRRGGADRTAFAAVVALSVVFRCRAFDLSTAI